MVDDIVERLLSLADFEKDKRGLKRENKYLTSVAKFEEHVFGDDYIHDELLQSEEYRAFRNKKSDEKNEITAKIMSKLKKALAEEETAVVPVDGIEIWHVQNWKEVRLEYGDAYCVFDTEKQELLKSIAPTTYQGLYNQSKKAHKSGLIKNVLVEFKRDYGPRLVVEDEKLNKWRFNQYVVPSYMSATLKGDKEAKKKGAKGYEILMGFLNRLFRNEQSLNIALDWISLSLMDRANTLLCLVGEEGVGKSLFCKLLERLHGEKNTLKLASNFAEGRFLPNIDFKTLGVIEEASLRGEKVASKLKSLVEKVVSAEKKGRDISDIENICSLVANSNVLNCLPLNGATDRKYVLPDITDVPPEKKDVEKIAKILGITKTGEDIPEGPCQESLKYFFLQMKKRFLHDEIVTDFSSLIVTNTYEMCRYECFGDGKRYIADIITGENFEWGVVMGNATNREDILGDTPKGILTYRMVVMCYETKGDKRQWGSKIHSATAIPFLKKFTINGEFAVEVLEKAGSEGFKIKILEGPNKYEGDDVTWDEYIRENMPEEDLI